MKADCELLRKIVTSVVVVALAVVLPLTLTSCQDENNAEQESEQIDGFQDYQAQAIEQANGTDCVNPEHFKIVTTLNVWESVISDVAGDCASVESILSDTEIAPDTFKPTDEDAQKLSDAKVVVLNGEGLDNWATSLISETAQKVVVGTEQKFRSSSPFLWFSVDAISSLIDKLAVVVGTEKSHLIASTNLTNLMTHISESSSFVQKAGGVRRISYTATSTILSQLFGEEGLGMLDRTPEQFKDVLNDKKMLEVDDLQSMVAISRVVNFVVIEQPAATGGIASQIKAGAKVSGVTVLDVTILMPDEFSDLFEWTRSIIDKVKDNIPLKE